MNQRIRNYPYAEIIEQPCSRTRFRYECEARFIGSLVGCNSTEHHKSWPTIKVIYYYYYHMSVNVTDNYEFF